MGRPFMRVSWLALLAVFASVASANVTQTYVEAGEIGQGFLLKRLDACYLITPEHVVKDSFFASLTAGTESRSRGDATALQTFGYDLAIFGATGAIQNDCGSSYSAFASATADILKSLKSASQLSVSTISADGARSLTPVNIASVDLLRLYVQPTDPEQTPLLQGMSGSLVYVGQTPVGMLQSVDAQTGQGVVLRIDRLLETINPFFTDGLAITSSTPLTQLVKSVQLTRWSHPVPAEVNSAMISDGNPSTHWRYRVHNPRTGNPLHNYQIANQVRLEFSLGSELRRVNSITLSNHSGERDSFMRDFEVLASRTESGAGWVPVYAGTWMLGERDKQIKLSHVAARRLMLVVRSHWNPDSDSIAISEIKIDQSTPAN